MTLARSIAEFVHGASVPDDVRAAAHIAVVDCIGCILAGAATSTTQTLVKALGDTSGPATLLGLGRTASIREAALVNGTAAHALDYDDVNWSLYGHPSVAILPTLLAIAEVENPTYAELLDAYALGVEVAGKLGRWTNPALYLRGWHATSAVGVIGAAAGAARLMKLSGEETMRAMAASASMAAGIRENFGTMVKPFHAGRAAEAGVLAASLARAGFTASEKALDGRYGFFNVLTTEKQPSPEQMLAELGQPWDCLSPGIVLKRYAACGATHCALDAALALRAELAFAPEDVAEIRCGSDPFALKVLQYHKPRTGLEGKFSMQFCLALAALEGQPRLTHFTDRWATSPAVVDLVSRVVVEDRTDLGMGFQDAVPAEVEIHLRDGRRASRVVHVPSGDPRNPMDESERRAKFLDCVSEILPDGQALWERVQGMDAKASAAPVIVSMRGQRMPPIASYG